jgi:non-specific serine/threonine protein kinase
LVRRELQADGEPRFAMLETIREFARERLAARGREDELRDRLAAYCLALTEQAGSAGSFGGVSWRAAEMHRIARELDNLRAALDWLEYRDPGRALRLMAAIGLFWNFHWRNAEGRARLAAVLAASGASRRTPAGARALVELAHLDMLLGDLDAAYPLLCEAVAIQREIHDLRGIGQSYWLLGRLALRRRETAPLGAALIEHGLAIARAIDNHADISVGLISLGQALRIAGDPAGARACWEECRQYGRDRQRRLQGSTAVLSHLAGLAVDGGDLATARQLIEETFASPSEIGGVFAIARALELAAAVAASLGNVAPANRALRLAGAAARLREEGAVPLTWYQEEELERWLAPARELLGARANDAWAAGRRLTLDQAIAEALD